MATEKRLIDIEKVYQRACAGCIRHGEVPGECYYDEPCERLIFAFTTAEPVDAVEVVHGEWVGTQYDGYADGCPVYDLWECTNCREEYESEGDPPPYNYCPNCGAKMDEERRTE